jgi:DNA-binding LytR/AlgR family response regulator
MNCIIIDDDPVVQKQLASFISKSELLDLKGIFINPVQAFGTIQGGNIEVIFLDIEMPEMSGLEFLDEANPDINIIVISGDRKYALDTFEYNVTDYLLKPVEYSRFIKSVYRALERILEKPDKRKSERMFVKINEHFVRFKINDIVKIQSGDDKKLIVTKKKSFTILSKLFDTKIICENKNFFKINDSVIVNLNEISEVCDNFLIFKDSENIENVLVDETIANEISVRINKIKE